MIKLDKIAGNYGF